MNTTDCKVLDFTKFKKEKEQKSKDNQSSHIGMSQEEFEQTFMKNSIKSLFGEKGMSLFHKKEN